MTGKKLKLVTPTQPQPGSPPRPLGQHGMAFWRAVHAEYGVEDAGGLEILAQACQAIDRAESCAAKIAKEGETMRLKAGLYKSTRFCGTNCQIALSW